MFVKRSRDTQHNTPHPREQRKRYYIISLAGLLNNNIDSPFPSSLFFVSKFHLTLFSFRRLISPPTVHMYVQDNEP